MDIFDKLTSSSDLASFIDDNIDELYDFLLAQSFSDLSYYRVKIEEYILSHLKIIKELDFTKESTRIFTILLLDTAERFGFLLCFQRLYNLLIKNNCEIGSRIQASALYLIGIRNISDYENIICELLNKLSLAYIEEEDNEDKVIATVINYYAQVLHNFGKNNFSGVLLIKNKIISESDNPKFFFLKNSIVNEIFNLDCQDSHSTYKIIQDLLDVYLKRTKKYIPFSEIEFLIEEHTAYAKQLKTVNANFDIIHKLSVNHYKLVADDSIFYSLQRGIRVITDENQLFAYMNSYGNMHFCKLISSYKYLPQEYFKNELSVIDWGCGQGLATMALIDFLNANCCEYRIKSVYLIEPSEIALKRASLHIDKYNNAIKIRTINKDIDSLSKADFNNCNISCKLHLFSNILDIDLFSLTNLTNFIYSNFKGENYFVCVSPYVNDLKTNRLDGFMKFFSTNCDFEEIVAVNNRAGEWERNWTRVLRVFRSTW